MTQMRWRRVQPLEAATTILFTHAEQTHLQGTWRTDFTRSSFFFCIYYSRLPLTSGRISPERRHRTGPSPRRSSSFCAISSLWNQQSKVFVCLFLKEDDFHWDQRQKNNFDWTKVFSILGIKLTHFSFWSQRSGLTDESLLLFNKFDLQWIESDATSVLYKTLNTLEL